MVQEEQMFINLSQSRGYFLAARSNGNILTIHLIHKSHNASVPYPIMHHSEQKGAHFCSEWGIVEYGKVHCGICEIGALYKSFELYELTGDYIGQGPFQYKDHLLRYEYPIIKRRWLWDCLIFIIGIPTVARQYLETGTWISFKKR